MSNIRNLTEKIIHDATKKREQRLLSGQKELEKQKQLQLRKLETQQEERLERFEKEQRAELSLKVSDLHMKARNQLLVAKQAVLKELFQEAMVELRELSAEQFNRFVQISLEKIAVEGSVEFILGEYSQHYATLESKAQWQAVLPAVTFHFSEKTIPQRSGFILRQEAIEFNFIFEAILNAEEEQLSNELLQLIFDDA